MRLTSRLFSAGLLLLGFFATPHLVQAQYRVQGKVVDSFSQKALSSASIQIDGSNQGTITNSDGEFSIWTQRYPVVLRIRHIGYSSARLRLTQHSSERQFIRLEAETLLLGEVEISDEDPAVSIMRKVLERKALMRAKQSSYESDSYTRFLLYRRKNRDDVLVQMKEQIGRSFWRKDSGERQFIHAEKSYPEDSGDFRYVKVLAVPNLYDDHLTIFGTKYIAPTHPDALKHYRFRFGDKKSVDGKTVYEIYLSPKSASRSAMVGRIRVLDEEYILLDASVKPNRFSPPNEPVRDFEIRLEQQFSEFEKGIWLPIDFKVEGWLEFGRGGVNYPRASFKQSSRLTRHLVNGSTPDSLFQKDDRLSYDPVYKFRDFLFEGEGDFVQLTKIESRSLEQIRPGSELSREFVRSGLLAQYISVPVTESKANPNTRPWWMRPKIWFNRVDGLRLGLSTNHLSLGRTKLHYEGGFAVSRRRPDFLAGLELPLFNSNSLGLDADFSLFDQLRSNSSFSTWTLTQLSVPTFLGSIDYFDYHQSQGAKAQLKARSSWVDVSLGLRREKLSSVKINTSVEAWLFGDDRAENPDIEDGSSESIFLKSKLRLPNSLPGGISGSMELRLDKFDNFILQESPIYNSRSIRAELKIPTFSYRRSVPSSIVVKAGWDKFSGDVPFYARANLDTSVMRYAKLGTFATQRNMNFLGEESAFVHWEKRLETLPFEWLRLYPLSDRGMSLSFFGLHGRITKNSKGRNINEWGIKLHRILGYPIQVHGARSFDGGPWVFGFGWRK